MDVRQLFIAKVEELRELLANGHEYNLLKASAVVRHLILDGGGSLTTQVCQLFRLPITFAVASGGMVEWSKRITGEYPTVFTVGDSIFPADCRDARPWKYLSDRDFLKEQVLVLEGVPYTIKDVIDFTAHVAGGVHSKPANDRMRRLKASNSGMSFFGLPPAEMLMRGIGRSVLHACAFHEICCLNDLGVEALESGHAHPAAAIFERALARALEKDFPTQFPEHFSELSERLAEAKAKAVLVECPT